MVRRSLEPSASGIRSDIGPPWPTGCSSSALGRGAGYGNSAFPPLGHGITQWRAGLRYGAAHGTPVDAEDSGPPCPRPLVGPSAAERTPPSAFRLPQGDSVGTGQLGRPGMPVVRGGVARRPHRAVLVLWIDWPTSGRHHRRQRVGTPGQSSRAYIRTVLPVPSSDSSPTSENPMASWKANDRSLRGTVLTSAHR